MSLIDASILLGAVASVAAWWRLPGGEPGRVLLAAMFGLCLAQLAVEGFYWQFIPVYLFVGVFAGLTLRGTHPSARLLLPVVLLLGIAGGAWAILPVPGLTEPDGPYPVGTRVFRWVDASRSEDATRSPSDRRNLIVQAWYPSVPEPSGTTSIYMDGLDDLPGTINLLPSFIFRSFDRIDTNAVVDAPVAPSEQGWPVVLFSPGYGAPRAFYTGIATSLASRGYVVVAIDHPYEASVTQLADGRIVTPTDADAVTDRTSDEHMTTQQGVRAADLIGVLDRLDEMEGIGGALDRGRIAAVGHSFGGAAALAAMARDPRIRAAVNIDGTLYGTIARQFLDRPVMLLESDRAVSGHGERYLDGARAMFERLGAPGWRYQVCRADHFAFTDAPLFFSHVGRIPLSWFTGGSRDPVEVHRITVDALDAFLQEALSGTQGLAAAMGQYGGVVGGRVDGNEIRLAGEEACSV